MFPVLELEFKVEILSYIQEYTATLLWNYQYIISTHQETFNKDKVPVNLKKLGLCVLHKKHLSVVS